MRPILILCALLAACAGYDPPMAGDHTAPSYRSALEKCRKTAQAKADQAANATPTTAIRALFASDDPYRQDVQLCMQQHGYHP